MKNKNNSIKKIALINDLSGYGNCSLTAAIPTLTALGHEVHPLPTAVFSNQTAYDSYCMIDLSSYFEDFIDEWEKIGAKFDYIYSGFSLSTKNIDKISSLCNFKGAKLFVDPVLGDNGSFYKCFDEKFLESYKNIIKNAEYITPNLTEACLLTEKDFKNYSIYNDHKDLIYKISNLLDELYLFGAKKIIITGIIFNGKIYTAYFDGVNKRFFNTKKMRKNYSGTGDLFASIFLGYMLKGINDISSIQKTIKIISKGIKISLANNTPRNQGIDICKIIKNL